MAKKTPSGPIIDIKASYHRIGFCLFLHKGN